MSEQLVALYSTQRNVTLLLHFIKHVPLWGIQGRTCTHTFTHLLIHTCSFILLLIHPISLSHTHTHTHTQSHTHVTVTHTHTQSHVHSVSHTHTQSHTRHTYTCTHTHIKLIIHNCPHNVHSVTKQDQNTELVKCHKMYYYSTYSCIMYSTYSCIMYSTY